MSTPFSYVVGFVAVMFFYTNDIQFIASPKRMPGMCDESLHVLSLYHVHYVQKSTLLSYYYSRPSSSPAPAPPPPPPPSSYLSSSFKVRSSLRTSKAAAVLRPFESLSTTMGFSLKMLVLQVMSGGVKEARYKYLFFLKNPSVLPILPC